MEKNDTEIKSKSKIELAFQKLKVDENDDDNDDYISKGPGEGGRGRILQRFSASVEEVTDWFKDYHVDTIELWISGVIETGGITRLVVSAKGEGGLRVVLKPKNQAP